MFSSLANMRGNRTIDRPYGGTRIVNSRSSKYFGLLLGLFRRVRGLDLGHGIRDDYEFVDG